MAAAWRQHEYRAPGKFPPPPPLTSLKRMMLGCRSERWFMISLATFSSICEAQKIQTGNSAGAGGTHNQTRHRPDPRRPRRTLSPRGMYFMATSSLVSLFRMSRATPKLPEPMSLSSSYLSIGIPGEDPIGPGGRARGEFAGRGGVLALEREEVGRRRGGFEA